MKTTILTILITFFSIGSFAQTSESENHQKKSAEFEAYYNKADYNAIFNMYAQVMKDALPLDKTKAFFGGLNKQVGKIEERSFIEYNTGGAAVYKKDTAQLIIHFNSKNEIDGFFIKPFTESKSSHIKKETKKYKKIANEFQKNYNQENYEVIFELFDSKLQKDVKLSDFTRFLKDVKPEAGKINNQKFISFDKNSYALYKLSCEKATLGLKLSLNEESRIKGIYLDYYEEPIQESNYPKITTKGESEGPSQFFKELDHKIPLMLKDYKVPGLAIALIENGEVILQKGYGYSNIIAKSEVCEDTGFNIGSISKTVAAWGVMKLVEKGKIKLDDPVEKHLTRWHLPKSEFDANKVTIRRLLSHTAGLSLHGYPGWSPKDTLPTIEESLNGKNNGPGRVEIILEPGTKWKYSGGGFTILQLLIEEVSKQNFENYMQTEVLNPLGMLSSSYTINEKILNSSSKEYDNSGKEIDFELFTAKAAAGFQTTIEDFTKFAQASMHKFSKNPVLANSTISEMLKPTPASDGKYGLGYGIDTLPKVSTTLVGHSGANTGWHAIIKINPASNDGFIVFTNGGRGYHIYKELFCDWIYWKTGKILERCKN